MNQRIKLSTVTIALAFSADVFAASEPGWFTQTHFGASQMSDLNANTTDVGSLDGRSNIDLSSGFTAGASVGYRYGENVAVDLAWEYRSNESEVTLADGQFFEEGNYASNIFALNGMYIFDEIGSWQPYVGAGVTWIQEIDIDLESEGVERSYSGSGDMGFQILAGTNYALSERWVLRPEFRYGSITGISLDGEDTAGEFSDLDYKTMTLQLGLAYQF